MREKKGGALSRVQKLKKRLSHSFGRLSISKEEADEAANRGPLPYNGYSEEFLDRLEPNGNIPADKDRRYESFKDEIGCLRMGRRGRPRESTSAAFGLQ